MSVHESEIAIIVPYFQREPGLLRQCVQSVLDTRGRVSVRILVVDDGSPLPATEEIGDLQDGYTVRIIPQENAGPAAARNTGLDHVGDTPFVTFLDSDDQWTGSFLQDAVRALEQGYDLFIGDSQRGRVPGTRFHWGRSDAENIQLGQHRQIQSEYDLYEFVGDFFDLVVRRSNVIGPNTMAYRVDRFPDVRFPENLIQGEDRLFKLRLGQNRPHVAFSPRVYAEEGEGVNIFDKSGWNTEGYLGLMANYVTLAHMILDEIPLNARQRAFVRGQLGKSRRGFLAGVLHQVRHRKPLDWSVVAKTFRNDPVGALLVGPNVLRLTADLLTNRGGARRARKSR
ncbi:glycosyltransferase family 2 protein [Thioalkalivibrio sp. ALE31]|uniref:glycosyltransferase family 2 protein n=1 Tax=Thioalkalivibrio sp. ALE31 TaxID=1158182 RepID=UPI000475E018|nr:glycosyltransferase family 2 protein [Thioalkalivibrio sp. ALE31]